MSFDLIKYLNENSIPHSISESGAIDIPGILDLADNKDVTALPDNLTVGEWLDLRDTQITTLPENLTVGSGLSLCRTQITTLPVNLVVSGYLCLSETPIAMLPEGLKVGSLDLSDTQISTLPENLRVDGSLDLRNTQITTLPVNLLVVSDCLNLYGTPIAILPEGLKVGDYLELRDTQITTLPDYFTCSSLFLDPERFSNVAFRKNCGENNRTIFAVRANETFYIAADYFYGPLGEFEDAVDRKYSGEAAEAYKQAGRDCIDELKEKLCTRPE